MEYVIIPGHSSPCSERWMCIHLCLPVCIMTRGKDEAAVSFPVIRGFRATVYRIPIHAHPYMFCLPASTTRSYGIFLFLFLFFPHSRLRSITCMHACLLDPPFLSRTEMRGRSWFVSVGGKNAGLLRAHMQHWQLNMGCMWSFAERERKKERKRKPGNPVYTVV